MNASDGLRLGLSLTSESADLVVLDEHDAVVASAHGAGPGPAGVLGDLAGRLDLTRVTAVMLVSTLLGARLSAGELARVGVLRIGAPATTAVPPLAGWPEALAARIRGPRAIVVGGADIDGDPLGPLDLEAIRAFARECRGCVDAVAVSAVFAPIDAEDERRAALVLAEVLGPQVPLSLSHRIGGFGLLERENAAILNAALTAACGEMLHEVRDALRTAGVDAELFVAQNDGTLLADSVAATVPIRLQAARLATVLRGARMAHGDRDGLIAVDVSDGRLHAGALRGGEIVMDALPTTIAGVRVNQILPLGYADGAPAPAAGGDDELLASPAVERVRRHAGDLPVVLGSGDASGPSASAVGAACAPVSAVAWEFIPAIAEREERLAAARHRAIDEAILAGADPTTTGIVAEHETPLSYMSAEASRVLVRAEGRPFAPAPETHHPHTERHPTGREAP